MIFPPARTFFPLLSVAVTILLGNLQAYDGQQGQKSRAQVRLGRWGNPTGRRKGRRGFRQEFAPVGGVGVNVGEGFSVASPRRVAAKGVMAAWVNVADQRAARAAARLYWRMVDACLALAGPSRS